MILVVQDFAYIGQLPFLLLVRKVLFYFQHKDHPFRIRTTFERILTRTAYGKLYYKTCYLIERSMWKICHEMRIVAPNNSWKLGQTKQLTDVTAGIIQSGTAGVKRKYQHQLLS